jgi:hypothetical protein
MGAVPMDYEVTPHHSPRCNRSHEFDKSELFVG